MNSNIILKKYQSLSEMENVIDKNKILIRDNQYPNTFVIVSCGNNHTFGFVTDSFGCDIAYVKDPVCNTSYIGVGKHLMEINNEGNLVFCKPLRSILVDLIIRPGKDLIVVCELNIYSMIHNKEKWCIGTTDMVYDYALVNEDKDIKLELGNGNNILVDIENGEVSFETKELK